MSHLEITGFDCGGSTVLAVIKFIMNALDIIFIIMPMILIVMLMIDFVKSVTSSDEEAMGKNRNLSIKRVIMCIALFLVEPITHAIIEFASDGNSTYISCVKIAQTEDISKYKIEIPEVKIEKKDIDLSGKKSVAIPSQNQITGSFDIKDQENVVGIMYTTWHDVVVRSNPNHKIITKTSNYQDGVFYYWGEPALGFYKSSDKKVIKEHMKQLSDAGVDFIIIDNTNIEANIDSSEWKILVTTPMTALLDTIVEMRKSGQKTPYVVNWINTGHDIYKTSDSFETWSAVEKLYKEFYKQSKYKNTWVYWDKKPFILTTSTPTSKTKLDITTRSMWVFSHRVNWSYTEVNNNKLGTNDSGSKEQISVSVAAINSYMSDCNSDGRSGGKTFYNQWKNAFEHHPQIVTITWWNEWAAQHQGGGKFVDEYDQECSRDIEPMKGGHKDKYYKWMKGYIEAYKNNKSCPTNLKD